MIEWRIYPGVMRIGAYVYSRYIDGVYKVLGYLGIGMVLGFARLACILID